MGSVLILVMLGGFFMYLLFGINASWGDKRAKKISKTSGIIGFISLIALIGLCNIPVPLYEYRLNLYYLGGSERNVAIVSVQEPYIYSYCGSYSLQWHDGKTPCIEEGVVRCEILCRKKIKELTWKDKIWE